MSETWLAIELTHLALDLARRAQEPHRDLPIALSDGKAQGPRILDSNPAAQRLGVEPGLALSAALSLAGNLLVYNREPAAEQRALERLAAWCYQYSSAVSIATDQHTLLLETGGSERLLGDSQRLAQQLEQELLTLGYHSRVGQGPNPEAARLSARLGQPAPALNAISAWLRPLPLSALDLDPGQSQALEQMGFRHLGEIMRLPRKALARRLGTALLHRLDRLTGLRPDPQKLWQQPLSFESTMDLAAEASHCQALLFPISRLLRELCGVLRGCDRGIQSAHITLQQGGGEEVFTLRLQQPSRDESHLVTLLQERLERLRLRQPVRRITLRADDFIAFDAAPEGLFPDPENPASNPLDPLLERLQARLGKRSVYGLRGIADHRPERSWQRCSPQAAVHSPSMPHRPLWLFQQPRRCAIEDYRVLAGPERIESGWWDGHDCRRDYFVVRDSGGSTLWAYREYKPEPGWYLQGLFS